MRFGAPLRLPQQEPDPGDGLRLLCAPLDAEQLAFVRGVLRRSHGCAPCVLFGPPGTGKTKAVVEAVCQVFLREPGSRVLAMAPSDAAADILAGRILEALRPVLGEAGARAQLFRASWWRRQQAALPPRLLPVSRVDKGVFRLRGAGAFRVVVCTPNCAAALFDAGEAPADGFSHAFVDECGQSLEAEVLSALRVCARDCSIVLSGDPRQLPPHVRCRAARDHGLAHSLQERLMRGVALYEAPLPADAAQVAAARLAALAARAGLARGPAEQLFPAWRRSGARVITKLVRNYRSHEEIIAMSSRMFYDGELVPSADDAVAASMQQWEELGGAERPPVMWLGVQGRQEREVDSPSFSNPIEAASVVRLCKRLLASKRVDVSMKDVGVICAFRRQVTVLRALLRDEGLGAINVGQVEDFQGAEQRVVIVSLVLAAPPERGAAPSARVGLFGCAKKFNVSVTRAKALSVVVGAPGHCRTVPFWRDMLQYCVDQGTYRGCALDGAAEGDADAEDGAMGELLDAMLGALGSGDADAIYPQEGNLEAFFDDVSWRQRM